MKTTLRRASALLPGLILFSGLSPAFADYDSADNGKLFIACLVGLGAGVFVFFRGFSQLRTKRLIQDIPMSTIRAMAPGLVEINGSAVNWKAMPGPMTREDCVYYQYQIEQYVSSGKNSHWETILKGDSKENPFYVQDDTGTVRVEPEGSTVVIPDDYQLETGLFTDVPPHIDEFMDRNGISCRTFFGFEKKLRFTERHLKPAEKVFVMGTCQEAPTKPSDPPAGVAEGVCLARGQLSSNVFIVSDQSQRELESSYGWHAFFGIFGGLALIGGCLYGLLTLLGMA
jgi:hypothetical protein